MKPLTHSLNKYLLASRSRQMVHSQSLSELLFGAKCQFSRDYPSSEPPGQPQQTRLSDAVRANLALSTYAANSDNGLARDCLLTQRVMDLNTLLNRSRNVFG